MLRVMQIYQGNNQAISITPASLILTLKQTYRLFFEYEPFHLIIIFTFTYQGV